MWTEKLAADFAKNGYVTIPGVFDSAEVAAILGLVSGAAGNASSFRRSADLFAIRQVVQEIPELISVLKQPAMQQILANLFPATPRLIKSIYFDKPAASNWFVAWHQDLMVGVRERIAAPGFGPWTSKQSEVAVQPPRAVLENICTLRLHLDDCDETNGALRVVPGSHRHGIIRPEEFTTYIMQSATCPVPAGGLMLMKPLLLHASGRSTRARPRRVLHLEFSAEHLPGGLVWSHAAAS